MTNKPTVKAAKTGTKSPSPNSGTLDQMKEKMGGALATVRERGEDVISDTREKAYRAANETNRVFQEHPIAAVAAAVAAGAVVAIFLPKLAIATKAGTAAGKAGQMAQRAVRSSGARQAAQVMFAGLAKAEKAALQNAAVEAARMLGARVKSRKQRKTEREK